MSRASQGKSGPLSYPIDVRVLPEKGHPVDIVASEEERVALAKVNALRSIERFDARFVALRWREDGVRVTGRLRARIVQDCVLSLKPVENEIDEDIDATFVPETSMLAPSHDGEFVLDPNGDDPPEVFRMPMLDIGAVASEFFALAIDPYPRAPDAALPDEASDGAATGAFADLAKLKLQ